MWKCEGRLFRLPLLSACLAMTICRRLLLIWQFSLFPYPMRFAQTSREHKYNMPSLTFYPSSTFLYLQFVVRVELKGGKHNVQFKLSSLTNRRVMNCFVFLLLCWKCCEVQLPHCVWRSANPTVITVCFLKSP